MTRISRILINGKASDGRIPVTDSSVLRGDGCFEVIRAYHGVPYRLDDHLDRLQRSAARLGLELPPREALASWASGVAEEIRDGAVRMVATRGSSVPGVEGEPLLVVFGHNWERQERPARLLPVVAPWHAAGVEWELAGAKITSYAPNMAATRRAQGEGFDDALLVTVDGVVLEGPTFCVAWVVDDVVETPGLDLGILDSITRRVTFELCGSAGIPVIEVTAPLDRLRHAAEVFAVSTVREVQPVGAVGDIEFDPGPIAKRLQADYLETTAREPAE